MTRKEAIYEFQDVLGELHDEIEITENLKNACRLAIKALEQEQKTGHWILTDVEGNRVWHCRCSECDKDPQDYIGGSENWWLIKNNLPKACPTCGVKMIEPQERSDKE